MLYTVGKNLYAYDYDSKVLFQKTFPDEITMIKFDLFSQAKSVADLYKHLYIATYNPAPGGKLQKYILGDDPNSLELTPDPVCCWDGLVKVVDMDWRNSTRTYQ
jgi:hypothetical protein